MRHRGTVHVGHAGRRDRWAAALSVLVMLLSAGVLVSALSDPEARPGAAAVADRTASAPRSGGGRSVAASRVDGLDAADAADRVDTADGAAGAGTAEVRRAGVPTPAEAAERMPSASDAATPTGRWRRVLDRLDQRRARAYATADPSRLRRVYTPRSSVLQRDRALLLRYRRLRLRVHGMHMRVLELTERSQRRGRVVLAVRERLTGATVRGAGAPRRLRADDVDRRVLILHRTGGAGWRIAVVR